MDFYSFLRKDLQFLCKLNKIPANRTNVAMAEALSSLKTVKGIEKYCKTTESSVAESSVESPEKNVVTSPKSRRKQVKEGLEVVQTFTPITRRKNKPPVQRVYNTRLSSRLLKKEAMETEKKEHVEAVKISSYCDVVSGNDFGEVSEGKNVSGSDNVGVESFVSEIEQESESVKWKDADKDLNLRNTTAINMISKVLENNDLIDCLPWSDEVGVDICVSQADILPEVLANEGSDNVGVDFPLSEIEQRSESLNSKYADRDLDSKDTIATNLTSEELVNKGTDNVGVESSVSETELESEPLKWKIASRDLEMKDIASTSIESKVLKKNVEGFEMDTVEALGETPSLENMAVVDPLLHEENDDVVADSFLSGIDMTVEVLTNNVELLQTDTEMYVVDMPIHEINSVFPLFSLQEKGSDDVGVDLSFLETKLLIDSSNNGSDKNLNTSVVAETTMNKEILSSEGSDNVGVELSLPETEQPTESLKWKNGDYAEVIGSTTMKGEIVSSKGSDTVVVDLFLPETEQQTEFLNWKNDIGSTTMKGEIFSNGSDNVGVDLYLSETEQQTVYLNRKNDDKELDAKVIAAIQDNVEGFQVVPLKPIGEVSMLDHEAIVDMSDHKMKVELLPRDTKKAEVNMPIQETKVVEQPFSRQKKDSFPRSDDVRIHVSISEGSDDVGVHFSLTEADENVDAAVTCSTNSRDMLSMDTEKTEVEIPIQETKVVEQVFSPQNKGSDDVGVHISFSEGSDDGRVNFSFAEADENLDAAVTRSTDSKESESLKEQSKMESSEKVDYGESPHDLMIQPKSENLSSAVNSFAYGENLDTSVNIKHDIICNRETGYVYNNEKGLASLEEVRVKVIDSDSNIYSESYERTENSIHNSPGDDNSADTDLFQYVVYSKQLDSKREPVSEIPICNSAVEFAERLELTDSYEDTNDFSDGVPFVDESGDEDRPADDSDRSSEAFDDNSCDTEAGFDFLEYAKQQDRKRDSIASQILCGSCTKESADQSDTPELELTDSYEDTNDFADGVPFVDESGDEDRPVDDSYRSSEAFDDNSLDTKAEFDFLEYAKKQDRKEDSITSQIPCGSCTKESADQSDTPESFDSSVSFSSKVASYHQLVSGNSLTKESRLRVASDVSYRCSGIKKLSFDESQRASEVKSPSLKPSGQICPSSAPPFLQARKARISDSEPMLVDYPFTQKLISSGVLSLRPCNFANTTNYKPVAVSSATIVPAYKLKSNVSDKENIEHVNKVEVTKERPHCM